MASELRVNTLKDASGNNSIATSFVAGGSAKSWINFNGTGTIAIRDSFNVGSITDNGTGQTGVSFTSAFVNDSYAASGAFGWANNGNQVYTTPTSATVGRANTLEANAYVDRSVVLAIYHGDLA
tara:strand:+ start:332 stop:703 length:372 start_codon:yes stop_codon:yes gene_type:complete